jgi:serine/threonine protein kinase
VNPALLEAGTIFNARYEIVRCIKQGGMGAVYEVIQQQTRKRRALKVMLPSVVADPSMRSRFEAEATIVSAVESEHIADIIDAGVDDQSGAPFIVMELLKGEELGAMSTRVGPMAADDVVLFLAQASRALARTHAEGIIHRDLKPENLFVTYADDGRPRLKLLDFGIAKVLGEARSQTTRGILGTPLFISPEQVHGEVPASAQTDVYALAHIAFALLTGEPYWRRDEIEAQTVMAFLVKVMNGHVQPASSRALDRSGVELPPGFDAWFDRAAAVEPSDRHDGAPAMVEELARVFGVTLAESGRFSVPAPPRTVIRATTTRVVAATKRSAPPDVHATMTSSYVTIPKKSNAGFVIAAVVVAAIGIAFGASRLLATPEPAPAAQATFVAPPGVTPTAMTSQPAATVPRPSVEPAPSSQAVPSAKPTRPAAKAVAPVAPAPSASGWTPPVEDR